MTALRTSEPWLRRLIDASAGAARLPAWSYRGALYQPGQWLEGQVIAESSGDVRARRYEPHQDRAGRSDAVSDADRPGVDDGKAEDDASYGLLQCMGYNWRRMVGAQPGTSLNFEAMYDPLVGLAAGLWVLRAELDSVYRLHPHESESERVVRALCRFNGGPTGDALVNGDFRLRGYVEKVAQRAALVRADRKERGWL